MNIESALAKHAAGDIAGAEQGYRAVIAQDKTNHVALEKLALICLMTGRLDEGKQHLQAALKLNPGNPETHYNLAAAHKATGSWAQVVESATKSLRAGGNIPEVYLILGEGLNGVGKPDEAVLAQKKALALRPNYEEAHIQLGLALLAEGKLAEAEQSLKKSLQLNSSLGHAHYNLGIVLQQQGKFKEAIASCTEAIKLLPIAECYVNLGNAYFESRNYGEDSPKAVAEAITAFTKALALNPDFAEAYNNLGLAKREQGKLDDAAAAYRKAIAVNPNHIAAYRNLAFILDQQSKYDESLSCHEWALRLQCEHLPAASAVKRLGQLLLNLRKIPTIYMDEAEIQKCREAFTCTLNEASSLVAGMERHFGDEELHVLAGILFTIDNFYLPYQQLNDVELNQRYAQLVIEILEPSIKPFLAPIKKPSTTGKIRLGIATEVLREHHGCVWALGWLENLPKDDYEFFLYSLNGKVDETTKRFASFGTYRWLPFNENRYLDSVKQIKEDNLDILIVTDVGTSPGNRLISMLRLAAIQCSGWAHPVTSGSPNMDYFISNELMEPANADNHYSEKLIRLRNIGMSLEHPDNCNVVGTRADFGIPEDKTIYASVQSLFKYLPQFDCVYPAIAKQDANAFFVFLSSDAEHITAAFQKRLKDCFEQAKIDFDTHVKILPRLTPAAFMQLLTVLDVNLDSIGWSGGFTTLRSLSVDCPVVTYASEFMRGRHSYAMLKMIGVDELIANNLDEFVALASRIGSDKEYRCALVEKIKANKHKLLNDIESVRHLDSFIKEAVSNLQRTPERVV